MAVPSQPLPSPRSQRLVVAGALLALALLLAFYAVVVQAVQRAASHREHARVTTERQVVCSAFSAAASRDLCLLTLSGHAARRAVAAVAEQAAKVPGRGPQLTAALY
jgi:hypothetical protein